jgi:collagenase-like PrtC family protease
MLKLRKELIVPTNWDFELLDFIDGYPEVRDFYGKLKTDLVGGGRASYGIPQEDKETVKEWVGLCRKKGRDFCYLLNAYCLANKEYDPVFLKEFLRLVEWLVHIGVNEVMVAIPYLVKVLKREFPQLKVIASKFCNINSLQRAKFWEEHGVDEITLGGNITRNFFVLKKIVTAVNIKVHILPHDACLFNCHLQDCHHLMESHASQENCQIPYYRYYTTRCRHLFLSNPAEIIRSTFIRPEDLKYYKDIGINSFKLIDRNKPTKWIKNAIQSYSEEKYNGNLADLLSLFSWYGYDEMPQPLMDIETEDILNLQTSQSLTPYVYIDNRALDGFIDKFMECRCEELIELYLNLVYGGVAG